jgi:hypothetical protein
VSRMPARSHICGLASNREIPHLSTMAMGSTATSPSRFCTNDGEYDNTPRRGLLFSKRNAAPGGPNGGLSTGGWAVAEDLSADRTALRTLVSVAGGTLMRITLSTSGLAPPSKVGLQLKQPRIPHDIPAGSTLQPPPVVLSVLMCGKFYYQSFLFQPNLKREIQNVSITFLYLAFSQVSRIRVKTF